MRLQVTNCVQQRMNHSAKRQRALDDQGMAATAPSKEHATSSLRGRQEPSGAGGDLRLDVASSLNRTETDILGMMVEAAKLSKRNTVVRVAGGWVRDKLLGLEVNCYVPGTTYPGMFCFGTIVPQQVGIFYLNGGVATHRGGLYA